MSEPHGNIKHGGAKRSGRDKAYNTWAKMVQRCENPDNPDYKNYGGRGITVCEQWHDFRAFRFDMGAKPSAHHTIERVKNDEGYCPENCIWATRTVQARNRRARKTATHCKKGHELLGDNLYSRPDGKRGCKMCRSQNMKDFYQRGKE